MKTKKNQEVLLYFFAIVATLSLIFYFAYESHFNYAFPMHYSGDIFPIQVYIKSLIDVGWFFSNPYLGLPFGYHLADYPSSDGLNFLMMRFLTLFNHQPVVVMHTFYFATYFFATLTSLCVFRYLGINRVFALSGSLLFSFLEYHFFRGESHLLLSAYYAVPLYILAALTLFQDLPKTEDRISFKRKWGKEGFYCVLLALCASTGVYYAFFGAYFILAAGILSSLDKKHWQPFFRAAIFIFVIGGSLLINAYPTIKFSIQHGKNQEAGKRSFIEAEQYGLKISHLLFMNGEGGIGKLKKRYIKQAPLVNENASASMNLFGSIGFLFLLGQLLLRRPRDDQAIPDVFQALSIPNALFNLSRLNILAVLLATVGGFSTFFSLLISPQIRAYNRISVFIAFFSFAAFFLVIQKAIEKISQFWKRGILFIILLVSVCSIILTTLSGNWATLHTKEKIANDKAFVQYIEKTIPHGHIFQLPTSYFPEYGAIHKMQDYEHFRGYLHSKHLKWSYGAIQGRKGAQWQEEVGLSSPSEMLEKIILAGFSGIYINRQGYSDHAVALERTLTHLLQQQPIVSHNQDLAFYNLIHYTQHLRKITPKDIWERKKLELHNLGIVWGKGWERLRVNNQSKWHIGLKKGRSSIEIINDHTSPLLVELEGQLESISGKPIRLKIKGDLFEETMLLSKQIQFKKEILLQPGRHFLNFIADKNENLSLRLSNFSVKIKKKLGNESNIPSLSPYPTQDF